MNYSYIFRSLIYKLLIIILFTLVSFILRGDSDTVSAQSCSFSYATGCTITTEGCRVNSVPDTVGCSFGNSCPDGQTGQRCDYDVYEYSYRYCRYEGNNTYDCVEEEGEFGPGYCGCSGSGGGGDPPPGGGGGGGNSCPELCGCGIVQTNEGPGCWCARGGWQGHMSECPASAPSTGCPEGCANSGGTCGQCACTAPSNLTITSPAANAQIIPGATISWSNPTWGIDAGTQGDGECSGCSYSGTGSFKVFINGSDETARCTQSSGGVIPSNIRQCTLSTFPELWYGTNIDVQIRASNACASTNVNRTFTIPANQKPYCNTITASTSYSRLANGLFGVRNDETVTLQVFGGESDPYGPPRFAQLCYSIANQPESFYRTTGGQAWRCIGQSMNASSYNVSVTFNQLKADYNPPIPYSGTVDQHGFVIAANIADNMSNAMCSTNTGWFNGTGVIRPTPSGQPVEPCNGGTCLLRWHNNAPEVTQMSSGTTSGVWIGSEPDDDNGLNCVDNNPFNYNASFSDPDGSADIDRVEFNVATATQFADANNDNVFDNTISERNWPLRVVFAKEFRGQNNQAFANGTFFIRDTQVISNNATSRRCYDQNMNNSSTFPIDPTGYDTTNSSISRLARSTTPYTVWCYGYDQHTWADVPRLTNQTLNVNGTNVNVDVYYLRNDLEVYNQGYRSKLKAPPPGSTDWRNQGTYVAYERNGNRVFAQFRIAYLKDGITDRWGANNGGQYKNAWRVIDLFGKSDATENYSGSYMARAADDSYFHIFGDTRIDLRAPTVAVQTPTAVSASILNISTSVIDSGSGLNRIYGEAYSNTPEDASPIRHMGPPIAPSTYSLNDHPPQDPSVNLQTPFLWERAISGTSAQTLNDRVSIEGNDSGTLNFEVFVQDNACNLNEVATSRTLDEPWIMTKGGMVYTSGEQRINVKTLSPGNEVISTEFATSPFLITKSETGMSSELLATNSGILGTSLPNVQTTGASSLLNYSDLNNKRWFTELESQFQLQYGSNSEKFNYITVTSANVGNRASTIADASGNCSDPDKLCIINSSNLHFNTPATNFVCDRKTVFYVNGSVIINQDMRVEGDTNGCIFITSGDVYIGSSSYKSTGSTFPRYDTVEAFIISDGVITLTEDLAGTTSGSRDGLKIRGGLLSFGTPSSSDDGSIKIERTLKLLNNNLYPTVVIQNDPRYYEISKEVIGGINESYKSEVGYK